jgi:hypothetical protein
MAEGNFREYLKGEEVWTKKYFYVLRPVLACLWIENGFGAVPTEFQKLVDAVITDTKLQQEIGLLLEAKRNGQELRKGPRNETISSFTKEHILRLSGAGQKKAEASDSSALNRLFLDILTEVNGSSVEQVDAANRR